MTKKHVSYPIDIEWETWRIGEIIRSRRSDLRLSQEALAERVDVDVKTVGRWERGDIDFSGASCSVAVRLAWALETDVTTILALPR